MSASEIPQTASTLEYTSADVAPAAEEEIYLGLPTSAWIKIGTIVGLFAALFWPNLRRLWLKTNPINGEPNWGHAICVPVIGLYYLYIHREELLKARVEPLLVARFTRTRIISACALIAAGLSVFLVGPLAMNSQTEAFHTLGEGLALWGVLALALDWGLGTMLFGLLAFGFGIWPGQNDFVKDFGMVITLFGLVLMLNGWRVMKIAWFPIVFLVCAIPWPGLVYSYVASPLQFLAADVAVSVLRATGVAAAQVGTKIQIVGAGQAIHTLNVAEACAGLRSLMTFISVAAAVAFLSARPLWQKIIITLTAIPIAIFCNVMRVSGQGLLDHYVSEKWAEGFAHQFAGLLMLVPAFFLILLVGWILDHLFVEEMEETGAGGAVTMTARKPASKELVVEVPRRKPVLAPVPATAPMAPRTVEKTPPPPLPRPSVAPSAPPPPKAAPVQAKVAPVQPKIAAVPAKPAAPAIPKTAPAAPTPAAVPAPVRSAPAAPAPVKPAPAKPLAAPPRPVLPARPGTAARQPGARPISNLGFVPPPASALRPPPPAKKPENPEPPAPSADQNKSEENP